jgi:hypothetical protein
VTTTAERPAAPAASIEWRSIDPYDPRTNAENFDLYGWLATFSPTLLDLPEGRRALTRLDPLLFAIVYLAKHLKDPFGNITFADAHFLWVRLARRWIGPSRGPKEDRRALVAPRACGKSTWWFLILPMWAGAHGHARFAAAFADSGAQAELHLATFKREQSDNSLLRRDYPDYCEPARRHNGKTINDSQQMLYTKSGFAFAARGIDSTSLGMKVDEVRPDLLIFDDIEPPEATYSMFQREKRLSTVQNAILPLNEMARVVIVGTVTMGGSIIHSLVRDSKGEETEEWITDERFKTFHSRPIIRRDDGIERSIWPDKWSMDYLESIRKTRSFKLNYDNDPRGRIGEYWNEEDIRYGVPPNITRYYLFVDPPVTQKKTSDPCGLAVIGYAPGGVRQLPGHSDTLADHEAAADQVARLSRAVVMDAWDVRATGKVLRAHILRALAQWPQVTTVVLENNQGGDLWIEVMEGLPVKLVTFGSYEKKEVRLGWALDFYQRRRVLHAKVFPALEDQLTGFPRMQHDDIADTVACGVLRLLKPKPVRRNSTVHQR